MIIKDSFKKLNKAHVTEIHYNVIIPSCKTIHETLGIIKSRKDGRWNWFRKKTDIFKDWDSEGQGVVKTLREAIEEMYQGWSLESLLDDIFESKKDIDKIILKY